MHSFRNTYGKLSRAICFVLTMHILNLSIDPRDPEPFFIPEDLSVNKIESIAELIVEEVFGIANVFQEHNEAHDFNGCTISHCKIMSSRVETSRIIFDFKLTATRIDYFVSEPLMVQLVPLEISSPPPRA